MVAFAPSGLPVLSCRFPRLAPWAIFFRRFAAGFGAFCFSCYNACREKTNTASSTSCGGDDSRVALGRFPSGERHF